MSDWKERAKKQIREEQQKQAAAEAEAERQKREADDLYTQRRHQVWRFLYPDEITTKLEDYALDVWGGVYKPKTNYLAYHKPGGPTGSLSGFEFQISETVPTLVEVRLNMSFSDVSDWRKVGEEVGESANTLQLTVGLPYLLEYQKSPGIFYLDFDFHDTCKTHYRDFDYVSESQYKTRDSEIDLRHGYTATYHFEDSLTQARKVEFDTWLDKCFVEAAAKRLASGSTPQQMREAVGRFRPYRIDPFHRSEEKRSFWSRLLGL